MSFPGLPNLTSKSFCALRSDDTDVRQGGSPMLRSIRPVCATPASVSRPPPCRVRIVQEGRSASVGCTYHVTGTVRSTCSRNGLPGSRRAKNRAGPAEDHDTRSSRLTLVPLPATIRAPRPGRSRPGIGHRRGDGSEAVPGPSMSARTCWPKAPTTRRQHGFDHRDRRRER